MPPPKSHGSCPLKKYKKSPLLFIRGQVLPGASWHALSHLVLTASREHRMMISKSSSCLLEEIVYIPFITPRGHYWVSNPRPKLAKLCTMMCATNGLWVSLKDRSCWLSSGQSGPEATSFVHSHQCFILISPQMTKNHGFQAPASHHTPAHDTLIMCVLSCINKTEYAFTLPVG